MANHQLIANTGSRMENDPWTVLNVARVPAGLALHEITLSELAHKDERLDVLLPILDVVQATTPIGKNTQLAQGMLSQTLTWLQEQVSRLGIWADTSVDTATFDAILNQTDVQIELIVLYMPIFADGRSFSQATYLREQGYTGEMRLAGAFGVDQLAYLKRMDIDSFLLASDTDLDTVMKTLHDLPTAYGGDDVSKLPMFMA